MGLFCHEVLPKLLSAHWDFDSRMIRRLSLVGEVGVLFNLSDDVLLGHENGLGVLLLPGRAQDGDSAHRFTRGRPSRIDELLVVSKALSHTARYHLVVRTLLVVWELLGKEGAAFLVVGQD